MRADVANILCTCGSCGRYVIHDPFGEDMLDFPIAAYTEYCSLCCEAAAIGSDTSPPTLSPGAEDPP